MNCEVAHSTQEADSKTTSPFKLGEKLGCGVFGTVFKAAHLPTGATVAVKRLDRETAAYYNMPELKILPFLGHANIVRVLDQFTTPETIYIGMECIPHTLHEKIREETKFPERTVASLSRQMLEGLEYLQNRRIMHRDLKPSNILVTNDGTLKLADFGSSRKVPTKEKPNLTVVVQTLWYRAPEIMLQSEWPWDEGHYTTKIDQWSVGCIILEMLTGNYTFPGECEIDYLFKVFQLVGTPTPKTWPGCQDYTHYSPVWPQWSSQLLSLPDISANALDLLKHLLCCNPRKRWSARQALKHPFVMNHPTRRSTRLAQATQLNCKLL